MRENIKKKAQSWVRRFHWLILTPDQSRLGSNDNEGVLSTT